MKRKTRRQASVPPPNPLMRGFLRALGRSGPEQLARGFDYYMDPDEALATLRRLLEQAVAYGKAGQPAEERPVLLAHFFRAEYGAHTAAEAALEQLATALRLAPRATAPKLQALLERALAHGLSRAHRKPLVAGPSPAASKRKSA